MHPAVARFRWSWLSYKKYSLIEADSKEKALLIVIQQCVFSIVAGGLPDIRVIIAKSIISVDSVGAMQKVTFALL